MSKEEIAVLKKFMKDNFYFSGLKKAGVFPKEVKATDYEKQAEIICYQFGLKSIYEWAQDEIRCHISVSNPTPEDKFITVIKPKALIPKSPPTPTHNNILEPQKIK